MKHKSKAAANRHKMPIKSLSAERNQTAAACPTVRRWPKNVCSPEMATPPPLPYPSGRTALQKASQRCTVNLRSRFITVTMRRSMETVDSAPVSLPLAGAEPETGPGAATCPWSGRPSNHQLGRWSRFGGAASSCHKYFLLDQVY